MKPILSIVNLNPEVEAFAKEHFEIVTPETMTEEQALEIEVILSSGKGKAPKELLDRLPNLKMIDILGVGYDGVDAKECRERGITLCLTSGILTDDVADLAMGLTLSLLRRIPEGFDLVKSLAWENKKKLGLGSKVTGRRLGIVGLGQIGQAVAARAAGFKMEISYFDLCRKDVPYAYFDDLKALAEEADVLVLCAAANSGNKHLIDEEILKAIGPQGILVNVARGSLVDEKALVKCLSEGSLGGCALDVFEEEPKTPHELFAMPNVILTPHIASATSETRKAMAKCVIDNLKAHMEGKPYLTPLIWR